MKITEINSQRLCMRMKRRLSTINGLAGGLWIIKVQYLVLSPAPALRYNPFSRLYMKIVMILGLFKLAMRKQLLIISSPCLELGAMFYCNKFDINLCKIILEHDFCKKAYLLKHAASIQLWHVLYVHNFQTGFRLPPEKQVARVTADLLSRFQWYDMAMIREDSWCHRCRSAELACLKRSSIRAFRVQFFLHAERLESVRLHQDEETSMGHLYLHGQSMPHIFLSSYLLLQIDTIIVKLVKMNQLFTLTLIRYDLLYAKICLK